MTLSTFALALAVGRLLTWLLQTSGLLRPFWQSHPLLSELGECDLCVGFWVYLALGFFLASPFGLWPWWVEMVMFAAIASFTAHLLRLGWQAKFGTVVFD